MLGHRLQHLGREGAADRRNADDRGRLQRPDRGQEIADRGMVMRVAKLVIGEARPVLHHKAARVDEPVARERLGFGQALRHHGGDHEVGDAGRRLACAEEQHPLVGKLAAVDAQRREQAGERHRGRALNVVVEDIQISSRYLCSRRNAE